MMMMMMISKLISSEPVGTSPTLYLLFDEMFVTEWLVKAFLLLLEAMYE